jgi:hypothetical protein
MSDGGNKTREARLAEQLRLNLQRRKALARAVRTKGTSEPDDREACGEKSGNAEKRRFRIE